MALSVVISGMPRRMAVATIVWSKGSPWNPSSASSGAAAAISHPTGMATTPEETHRRHQSRTGISRLTMPSRHNRDTSWNETADTANSFCSAPTRSRSLVWTPISASPLRRRMRTFVSSRINNWEASLSSRSDGDGQSCRSHHQTREAGQCLRLSGVCLYRSRTYLRECRLRG